MFLKRFFSVIASRTIKYRNGKVMSIEVTEVASNKLKELEKRDSKIVRLEIDAGGCHGFQYNFILLPTASKLSNDDMYPY